MAEKILNYSPEVTAKMVAAYTATPTKATVEALAVELGKTVKSVIAKLSREGVYVKAAYVNKAGEKPVRKDAMVGAIATLIGVTEDKLDGLEKAPKAALILIANAIKATRDGTPDAEGEGEASDAE